MHVTGVEVGKKEVIRLVAECQHKEMVPLIELISIVSG
jgi:hypothetical protein